MKIAELKKQHKSSPQNKVEKTSLLDQDIPLFPHRISNKEKEVIYRQLNVLLRSGVDIKSSFEILFQQLKNQKTNNKLQQVLDEIISGKTLSIAIAQHPDFSPYEVFSLQIGEETGKLTEVLERLTLYFENKISQRRQIVSALSYPVLIALTSFGAVSFMVFVIIPMFEEVFLRFNNELPALTQVVINFSHGVKSNVGSFTIVIVMLIAIIYFFRNHRTVRKGYESLILRLPVIGGIYKNIYLARFSDSMGLLIASSVPMIQTLEMVQKMIGFIHIEEALNTIKAELIQGKSLTKAMEPFPIFDSQLKALVKVGEEVNQLGNFFEKLSADYTNAVSHRTSLLSTFLEPIMIVFLGLVVGIILVAMYLPMFELSSSMDFGN